ncbi:MAG: hypothetical protein HRT90_02610 [Candidatus Margulisbacteria bacterium]|nr:hypothetical protein [Candidatus Margulisiibacteriota bacterium]
MASISTKLFLKTYRRVKSEFKDIPKRVFKRDTPKTTPKIYFETDITWNKRKPFKRKTGTLTFLDKQKFEGRFKNFAPYKGRFTSDVGEYNGKLKNNKPHGNGKMTYPDGRVYDGNWKDGEHHGKGKMTYSDGKVYDGKWKYGKWHGRGTLTYNGDIYKSKWIDGIAINKVIIIFENKDYYKGEWKNGKPQDAGKMYYASGNIYEGDWENGKRNGEGGFLFKGGDYYFGKWKSNVYAYSSYFCVHHELGALTYTLKEYNSNREHLLHHACLKGALKGYSNKPLEPDRFVRTFFKQNIVNFD